MDDRLRETLSAMMDDEADELSVRRLLSHSDQSDVCEQWQRWQQVRDLTHENHGPVNASHIAAAVRDQLDGRAGPEAEEVPVLAAVGRRWHMPVAALMVLALVVGFGAGAGWEAGSAESPALLASPAAGNALPGPWKKWLCSVWTRSNCSSCV